jgi:hypothetical protein
MLSIDVNKSGKIFDYLVHSGALRLAYDPTATKPTVGQSHAHAHGNSMSSVPPPLSNGVKQNGLVGMGIGMGKGEENRPGLVEVRVHENGLH